MVWSCDLHRSLRSLGMNVFCLQRSLSQSPLCLREENHDHHGRCVSCVAVLRREDGHIQYIRVCAVLFSRLVSHGPYRSVLENDSTKLGTPGWEDIHEGAERNQSQNLPRAIFAASGLLKR